MSFCAPLPTDRAGWEDYIRRCPAIPDEYIESLAELSDEELPDLAAALGGILAAAGMLSS